MALINNDLYFEATRGPTKRIQPMEGPGACRTVVFAIAAGGPVLPVGTPVYMVAATGHYAKCIPGAVLDATNDIWGIVYPADVTLSATGETVANVMVAGAIDIAELEALRASGVLAGTAQQLLDMARKPSNITRRIIIENLTKVGANAGVV